MDVMATARAIGLVAADGDAVFGTIERDDVLAVLNELSGAHPGNDDLFGHAGADVLIGGPGSDFLVAGRGKDVIKGGQGSDFSGVTSVGPDLWRGGKGSDHLTDFDGLDEIAGGNGGDACLATQDGLGGDEIHGGPGRDIGDADGGDHVIGLEVQGVNCFAD